MQYTATAHHNGLTTTGTGKNDHEAVTAALAALRAIWSIDEHRAQLIVRLGENIQYTTTASKYTAATN